MKKMLCIAVLLSVVTVTPVKAQTYDALWRQVDAALQKDLPKTALRQVNDLEQKAQRERAYGHLLKASLLKARLWTDISCDSLASAVRRIEALEQTVADQPTRAICQTVLSQLYQRHGTLGGDSGVVIAQRYRNAALSNPDLLANTKADGYKPFVCTGKDDALFGGSLLPLIADELHAWEVARAYYDRSGNRRAACMAAFYDWRNRDRLRVCQIDSLLRVYDEVPEARYLSVLRLEAMRTGGEQCSDSALVAYIDQSLQRWGRGGVMRQLVNERQSLTMPLYSAHVAPTLAIPGKPRRVMLEELRNVGSLKMRIFRTCLKGDDLDEYAMEVDDEDFRDMRKTLVELNDKAVTQTFAKHAAYETFKDSLTIPALPAGIYLLEFSAPGCQDVRRCLYAVSNLRVMTLAIPDRKVRCIVVDATTGQPVEGATVVVSQDKKKTALTTSVQGEVVCPLGDDRTIRVFASTRQDAFCPATNRYGTYASYAQPRASQQVELFTDRSIYRPGQTIRLTAVVYENREGIRNHAVAGKTVKMRFRDASWKQLQEQSITTDDFGKCTADIVIPQHIATGRCCLQVEGNTVYVRVENYKRPTFDVRFDDCRSAYQQGDTITVTARTQTYAGVAVQGARVRYQVVRKAASWWRYGGGESVTLVKGETMTDLLGQCQVAVPLTMPTNNDQTPRFCQFVVEADVTDIQGETHHASFSLPLGNRPSVITATLPDQLRKDETKPWQLLRHNAAGKEIAGKVRYRFDQHDWQTTDANAPIETPWHAWASGRHHLEAICEGDTLTQDIVLFGLDDKMPAVETKDWFYISDHRFPVDGTPVTIQVGSSDPDLYIAYGIFSGDKVIEQGFVRENATLYNRQLHYQDAYGDGLRLVFAWIKDGVAYTHSETILRPEPDHTLTLHWETFRDRLRPGQQEEWLLTVKDAAGRPAEAQMMAVLYDKSLDALARHAWSFEPRYSLSVPWTDFSFNRSSQVFLRGLTDYNPLSVSNPQLGHFCHDVLPSCVDQWRTADLPVLAYGTVKRKELDLRRMTANTVLMKARSAAPAMPEMALDGNDTAVKNVTAKNGATETQDDDMEANDTPVVPLRENMQETAFFYPTLMAEADGHVRLRFTLPDALTTWRFMGIAHTRDIKTGHLEGTIVAQKQLMVQSQLPRFLREGDETTLAARISNLTQQLQQGKARMEIIDAETQRCLYREEKAFGVEAGENTAVTFRYHPEGSAGLLICRITAVGQDFSDGEQQYLPVVSASERVTVTTPVTLHHAGLHTIDLQRLFPTKSTQRQLTIEYTSRPAWMMIQALASLGLPREKNAIEQATAYYSNLLAQYIVNQTPQVKHVFEQWKREMPTAMSLQSQLEKNPELKDILLTETPWTLDAQREDDQKQRLADFFDANTLEARLRLYESQLARLQGSDGGFAWYEGMASSEHITAAIAEMLTRLQVMTGDHEGCQPMLDKALDYLDRRMIETVRQLQRREARKEMVHFPRHTITWLYVNALSRRTLSTATQNASRYLLGLLRKDADALSIYGKATYAIILHRQGDLQMARQLVQSAKEYSVYTETAGRYYDTQKANDSWYSYRIPTVVNVIEALRCVSPDDRQTIDEMRRWLLYEKRAQQWDTALNSVNAIYAFLHGENQTLDTSCDTRILIDGNQLEMPKATAGLGYVKTSLHHPKGKTLQFQKSDSDTSWGAVYAQFYQPASAVEASASGLSVKCEIVHPRKHYQVGDRITVRLTIEAQRDLDFVQVMARRAACMEPVSQRSGYSRGAYCAPGDCATNYYFEKLPKGKHVIETEYYIDRQGHYETGTCTVQCAYAPEYRATAPSMVLTVE